MTGTSADVDVIIVNWNAGRLLAECAESVLRAETPAVRLGRLVIVDNASTDGSLDGVAGGDRRVQIIRNLTNLGFAAACNQGAADSQAAYLLFLNPDTRVAPDALAVPAAFLAAAENRHVGICGVRMVDAAGRTLPSNRRLPTFRSVIGDMTRLFRVWPRAFPPLVLPLVNASEPIEVEQLIGAFLFMRRELFEDLHGFDERFFVYYEEVDFSYRAKAAGFSSVYLPGSSAFHHGGYSSEKVRSRRLVYALRSRLLYATKHWGIWSVIGLAVATVVIELPARLLRAVVRLPRSSTGLRGSAR